MLLLQLPLTSHCMYEIEDSNLLPFHQFLLTSLCLKETVEPIFFRFCISCFWLVKKWFFTFSSIASDLTLHNKDVWYKYHTFASIAFDFYFFRFCISCFWLVKEWFFTFSSIAFNLTLHNKDIWYKYHTLASIAFD